MADPDTLVYAHIGDLHITQAHEANARDLAAIIDAIGHDLGEALDFVYLPGDNADNGTIEQYALVAGEIARLPVPVHVITGDHDMEPGSLDNFYAMLGVPLLPKAIDAGGVRCLFLDVCGPGTGGQDFRLGAPQAAWLRDELAHVARDSKRCVVFMHTYPADLRGDGETTTLNIALAAREVLLVDMGHTHYNEVANDGRTIFSATRSTGQIEEGPVGYSIVAIDRRAVSWRFRTLDEKGPLILITAPVDRRLAVDPDDPDHLPGTACELRARVISRHRIVHCDFRIDGGPKAAMREAAPGRWIATLDLPPDAVTIAVEAADEAGQASIESIEVARAADLARARRGDGSDADHIGAWEARHIFGTQLGPNRNGRKW